jgi:hypothetical protein
VWLIADGRTAVILWHVVTSPYMSVLLDLPAATYTTSAINCINNNMSIVIQSFLSNMFQPTWPSLDYTKHIQDTGGVNCKIEPYKKKWDLIWHKVQKFITIHVFDTILSCIYSGHDSKLYQKHVLLWIFALYVKLIYFFLYKLMLQWTCQVFCIFLY